MQQSRDAKHSKLLS